MKSLLFLLACGAAMAAVMNPIVDTDKSVNTYSVPSIAADVVNSSMTNEQKLDALFTFHRRMMHHFRAQQTMEDGKTTSDVIKMYTVYGCSWCTQQAGVFRTLCSEVFGWDNCQGTSGSGTLASKGIPGGHSSFHLRFDANDSWH